MLSLLIEFLTEFLGCIPVTDIVRIFLLLLHKLDCFYQILLFCLCILLFYLCIFLEMLELLLHCLHLCTLLDEHYIQILVILLGQDTLLVSLPLEILTKFNVVIGQLHYLSFHGLVVCLAFLPVRLNHSDSPILLQLHVFLILSLHVERVIRGNV